MTWPGQDLASLRTCESEIGLRVSALRLEGSSRASGQASPDLVAVCQEPGRCLG